jgi:integrase
MGRGPGIRAVSGASIQIDFVWQGRRYRERLRLPPTPPNLKYAARFKATIDHEIATGTFDFAKRFPDSPRKGVGGNLLSQLVADYCKGLERQLEPETVAEYLLDGAAFVAGVGDCAAGQLTRVMVREWVNKSPLSKKRLDNILVPVRGALRQAVEDGILESNPLADFRIRRVQKAESKIDPFTPEELGKLGRTELGYLWTFWAWTGLRSGELIGLRWSDVRRDLAGMSIRRAIRVGREKSPKTGSGVREVFFMPAAKAALAMADHRDAADAVFVNPSTMAGWYEDRALARAFRKACAAAGVRYRYPYQLRHTFASWALSAGENPAWVAKQMGHRDTLMVLRVYGRWIPQVDPTAGSKMAQIASR